MDFKLSNTAYNFLQILSWVCYSLFLFQILVTENEIEIIYAVMFSGLIMYLTLNRFIKNWYVLGRPLLLDWFRLSSFFFIIVNFFGMIDRLGGEFDSFKEYVVRKEFVLPAVLVVLVGLLGLKLGEVLAVFTWRNKKQTSKTKMEFKIANPDFFYVLALLTGLIQIFLILSGEVGYGTFQENTTSSISFLFQIVFLLSPLILAVFAVFKYLYKYKDTYFNVVFVIYFCIQIIYGFLSGMKESVITPIIIVLIPFLLGGFKIPKNFFYTFAFIGVLLYPLNDNYRIILREKPSMSKNEAFMLAAVKTFSVEFSDNFSEGTDSFSNRLSLFPYLIYTVENEASWNYYKNMDRYLYLPVAWILPRFVIPDKPKSDTGDVLNYMIRGWSGNSLSATTYGWAYFEGGYFFVFIIFLFFGYFISYFQYNLGIDTCFGLLMYIVILISLLKVESDVYFLISGILQSVLVTFIFYKFFVKEVRYKLEIH